MQSAKWPLAPPCAAPRYSGRARDFERHKQVVLAPKASGGGPSLAKSSAAKKPAKLVLDVALKRFHEHGKEGALSNRVAQIGPQRRANGCVCGSASPNGIRHP